MTFVRKNKTMKKVLNVLMALCVMAPLSVLASDDAPTPPKQKWSFQGFKGTFDRASAQRGLKVYREVCAACHGLSLVTFEKLEALGFSKAQVKAIAAEYKVVDGPNDEGEMFERNALISDRMPAPFKNEKAARAANNGAYPPDQSLIVKARKGGPDYVYALLTGYENPPEGFQVGDGLHYNKYFPGHQIAMIKPLNDGQVSFDDGTPATVDQMARDVTTFLTWVAEPELEERKRTGFKVMLYLLILTGLLYVTMRRVWKNAK